MSETPEDRGPSSLRIVKFDAKNPIHEGLMQSRLVNRNIDVNPKGHIVMPVAPGMEKDVVPLTATQIKAKKTAAKAVKNTKTDAPSMATPKDAGAIYSKPRVDKEANKKAAEARQAKIAATLKAKREGKA